MNQLKENDVLTKAIDLTSGNILETIPKWKLKGRIISLLLFSVIHSFLYLLLEYSKEIDITERTICVLNRDNLHVFFPDHKMEYNVSTTANFCLISGKDNDKIAVGTIFLFLSFFFRKSFLYNHR